MTCLQMLRWAGTGAQVCGVILLAGRLAPADAAFGVMLVGSVLWVLAAWLMRVWSMLVLNAAFTITNLIGVARWAA